MIILGIDTSQSASVALVDSASGEVLAAEHADDQRRHLEFIGPALASVLGVGPSPELVVTGIGPGPFTGLRVGIAAGIAVGQARGIPVSGLLSQAAIAEELRRQVDTETAQPAGPVLIASDARRKEVYFSIYEESEAFLVAGPFAAKPAEVATVLVDHGYRLSGASDGLTGADDGRSGELATVTDRLGRGILLYPNELGNGGEPAIIDPRAEHLAFAAARELAAGRDLPEPVPEYLREPDAKAAPTRQSSLR